MKRVIFIRHARAEDHNPDLPDFERSLTLKGKSVSRKVAKHLKAKIGDPGKMITSPAFRAYETAMIFASEYGIRADDVRINSSLYFSLTEKSLMEILKDTGEDVQTITLFGHNPSFTDLPGYLSRDTVDVVPKCGIVSLTFEIMTWSDLKAGTGKQELVLKPKNLK